MSDVHYATFDTALGTCAIAWSEAGVVRVALPEATPKATETRIVREVNAKQASRVPAFARTAMKRITRHLAGTVEDFRETPLDWSRVPPFHRDVYEALRHVPSGRTCSYGDLAQQVGKPGAARAIGQAMARNPMPIVVPCHRVLGAGKSKGGFSAFGGLTTKEKLLALEGVSLAPEPLFRGENQLPYDAKRAVRVLSTQDERLGELIARIGPLRLQRKESESVFCALAEAIAYQQLTGKAAATIFGRVRDLYPRGMTPQAVLRTPPEKLRACGLSTSKTLAVLDLAAKAKAGAVPEFDALAMLSDDDIVEILTKVRGIGRWTVEMLLIFRLGRPDVLPVDDYGVRKGFARLHGGELPTPKELMAYGERWKPYRSVASWYLWRAAEER